MMDEKIDIPTKVFMSKGENDLYSNPENWSERTLPTKGDIVLVAPGQNITIDIEGEMNLEGLIMCPRTNLIQSSDMI